MAVFALLVCDVDFRVYEMSTPAALRGSFRLNPYDMPSLGKFVSWWLLIWRICWGCWVCRSGTSLVFVLGELMALVSEWILMLEFKSISLFVFWVTCGPRYSWLLKASVTLPVVGYLPWSIDDDCSIISLLSSFYYIKSLEFSTMSSELYGNKFEFIKP